MTIEEFVTTKVQRAEPDQSLTSTEAYRAFRAAGGLGQVGERPHVTSSKLRARIRQVHGARFDQANVLWGVVVRL